MKPEIFEIEGQKYTKETIAGKGECLIPYTPPFEVKAGQVYQDKYTDDYYLIICNEEVDDKHWYFVNLNGLFIYSSKHITVEEISLQFEEDTLITEDLVSFIEESI